jgi:hypothetical protein
MYLTDHELTAASSVVAALAIVGGYLGIRSANRNALKLARVERAARYNDELTALKRATYAKCCAQLVAYWQALNEQDHVVRDQLAYTETRQAARNAVNQEFKALHDVVGMMNLIAQASVIKSTNEAQRKHRRRKRGR